MGSRTAIHDLPYGHNAKPGPGVELLSLADLFVRETRGELPVPLAVGRATVVASGRVEHFVPAPGLDAWMILLGRSTKQVIDERVVLEQKRLLAHTGITVKELAARTGFERDYLEDFDAAVASSKTAGEVEEKVKAKHKDLALDVILHVGASAAIPAK